MTWALLEFSVWLWSPDLSTRAGLSGLNLYMCFPRSLSVGLSMLGFTSQSLLVSVSVLILPAPWWTCWAGSDPNPSMTELSAFGVSVGLLYLLLSIKAWQLHIKQYVLQFWIQQWTRAPINLSCPQLSDTFVPMSASCSGHSVNYCPALPRKLLLHINNNINSRQKWGKIATLQHLKPGSNDSSQWVSVISSISL